MSDRWRALRRREVRAFKRDFAAQFTRIHAGISRPAGVAMHGCGR
jgi:hypothetical protein